MNNFIKPVSETIYGDIDMAFKPHPISGKVKVKHNIDAIKQALKNLVMYNKYEVPFESNMYCGIKDLLFENMDGDMVTMVVIKSRIESVIKRYEPRAMLNDVVVNFSHDQHAIDLKIVFTPVNSKQPVTIDLFLERIR